MRKLEASRVSVLMPMRDAAPFLPAAIESILTQSESDFSFLIIDDGSSDQSVEIAASMADHRTHVIQDGRQLGLAARLNWGLDHAASKFVVRMDADDIAMPQRLARQLAFMKAYPSVGICGSWYKVFEAGKPPREARLPLDHERLRAMTLFAAPFGHPTVIFNLKHLDSAGLRYSEASVHAEDYDLWERARHKTVLANIPEFLLYHRFHPSQVSIVHNERQRVSANSVRSRALLRLSIGFTEEESALHCDYSTDHGMDRIDRLIASMVWLRKLQGINSQRNDQAMVAECAWRLRQLNERIIHHVRLRLPPICADAIAGGKKVSGEKGVRNLSVAHVRSD